MRQWAGSYNMTPDAQPILGGVEEVDGFYLSVGYSGHGRNIGRVSFGNNSGGISRGRNADAGADPGRAFRI